MQTKTLPPQFGTSGLRGLVRALTPDLVAAYTRAFLAACPTGGAVHLGWDLRESSPAIAEAVARAVTAAGQDVTVHGPLPTPALALRAGQAGQAAIMVTGSHIPADRNGLKFYTPDGEISKPDEGAILARLDEDAACPPQPGTRQDAGGAATQAYVARYGDAFGPGALAGFRIGVYQHSSTARDIMVEVVTALGARAIPLARSETFIPVDTEAVDPATRDQLGGWCAENRLDALLSTDGDADRPMVADHLGRIVPGDVLGALTARMLGAEVICTPVSSNAMIERMPDFAGILRCRIGSPFVIAAMTARLAETPEARVVGYEANGGFLLGFDAEGPVGPISPLMTRDCLLPMLAPLALARSAGQSLADLVAALPPRFTAANRLTGIAPDASARFLDRLSEKEAARADFFDGTGPEETVDRTDGLRVTFAGGDVVHLRPSGNAPEFRCYTEADTPDRAADLLETYLMRLRAAF